MLTPQHREKPLVFLSYSRTDVDEVKRLRAALIEGGIAVWWDQDILPGQDWKYAIRAAMQHCDTVVLCLSATAVARVQSGVYPEVLEAIKTFRTYRPGEYISFPCDSQTVQFPPLKSTIPGH